MWMLKYTQRVKLTHPSVTPVIMWSNLDLLLSLQLINYLVKTVRLWQNDREIHAVQCWFTCLFVFGMFSLKLALGFETGCTPSSGDLLSGALRLRGLSEGLDFRALWSVLEKAQF